MLFTKSGLQPGQSVLVQGASGGVATACIAMARAAGFTVYATARTEAKQVRALELGAHAAFATSERLPHTPSWRPSARQRTPTRRGR